LISLILLASYHKQCISKLLYRGQELRKTEFYNSQKIHVYTTFPTVFVHVTILKEMSIEGYVII
jgi:hypothetical protein